VYVHFATHKANRYLDGNSYENNPEPIFTKNSRSIVDLYTSPIKRKGPRLSKIKVIYSSRASLAVSLSSNMHENKSKNPRHAFIQSHRRGATETQIF